MTFLFPLGLWLTLVVPILVGLYIWAQRRRQKYALRYASLSMVKEAMGRGPGARRHVPPALFLLAMFFMTAALARPAPRGPPAAPDPGTRTLPRRTNCAADIGAGFITTLQPGGALV